MPVDLPGPTGESNRYSLVPRQRVLCMGAGAEKYVKRALELGCYAIAATLDEDDLTLIEDLEAVVYSGQIQRGFAKHLVKELDRSFQF